MTWTRRVDWIVLVSWTLGVSAGLLIWGLVFAGLLAVWRSLGGQ